MALLGELWGMREGVSQCWWLGRHCVVDWEAWAAIGTFAAAAIALSVSVNEGRRRRSDQEARAIWLRLQLIHPMQAWESALLSLRRKIDLGQYALALQMLTEVGNSQPPLGIPAALNIAQGGLHDLGEAAPTLANAIYCSREVSGIAWMFLLDFEEILEDSSDLERESNLLGIEVFRGRVEELLTLVSKSVGQLNIPFDGKKKGDWKDFVRTLIAKVRAKLRSKSGSRHS